MAHDHTDMHLRGRLDTAVAVGIKRRVCSFMRRSREGYAIVWGASMGAPWTRDGVVRAYVVTIRPLGLLSRRNGDPSRYFYPKPVRPLMAGPRSAAPRADYGWMHCHQTLCRNQNAFNRPRPR